MHPIWEPVKASPAPLKIQPPATAPGKAMEDEPLWHLHPLGSFSMLASDQPNATAVAICGVNTSERKLSLILLCKSALQIEIFLKIYSFILF